MSSVRYYLSCPWGLLFAFWGQRPQFLGLRPLKMTSSRSLIPQKESFWRAIGVEIRPFSCLRHKTVVCVLAGGGHALLPGDEKLRFSVMEILHQPWRELLSWARGDLPPLVPDTKPQFCVAGEGGDACPPCQDKTGPDPDSLWNNPCPKT